MTTRFASLLALLFVAPMAVAQTNLNQPRIPEITASGRGEVAITPDRATAALDRFARLRQLRTILKR